MKTTIHTLLSLFTVSLIASVSHAEPLASWNDTAAKQRIIEFVESTTDSDSPNFVPRPERIATFDNDGTLWSEQPMYFQLFFIFDRIQKLASQNDWKTTEPFASVLKGDYAKALSGGDKAIMEMVTASSSGMTGEEYASEVGEWIETAKHPETKVLYTEMVFQPMLELMDYLRSKGYKVFIVSGGGVDFMRVFAEKVYGVPPEQVVGSEFKVAFAMKDGIPVIQKTPSLDFIDDKTGKPEGIYQHIARRPVFAAGKFRWRHADAAIHHHSAQRRRQIAPLRHAGPPR